MEVSAAAHQRWQAAQQAELAAPDSWLGLIGLFWLEAGENTVGHAPECAVCLPLGPGRLGSLWVDGSEVAWQSTPACSVEIAGAGELIGERRQLHTDRDGAPSAVISGSLVLIVIEREGRLAARVRNLDWAAGTQVAGRTYYDYDLAWKIEAGWESLAEPLTMTVPNMSGEFKQVEVTHQAVFTVAGQAVTLLPMSVGDKEVFFVFRDRSSGRETYGAGRFLKVPVATMEAKAGPRVDGKISLDFNFAYNPPCAFTPFATCPLPPPENWLPFAVLAGEQKWVKAT